MNHDFRHAAAATALSYNDGDPDIRILRRVSTLEEFPLSPRGPGPFRKIAIVDTETTGTDAMTDEVIDIAVVVVEVDAAGEIVGIVSAGQALRDPHMPIPAAITRLTGISDEDVAGKVIDLDRLERRLADADVRIAHVAQFDIAFIENLMPGLAEAPWACSAYDFDWAEAGMDGRKLGHLLMQLGFFSPSTHRAMADVIALLHVLAHRLPDGSTVLGALLAKAEQRSIRFEATGAPFERRGILKSRGYRWDARAKVWWIEITNEDFDEEEKWFRLHVKPFGAPPRLVAMTWHLRHR